MTFATPTGSLRPFIVPYALQIGGDVVLWGLLVQEIGFQY